MHDICWCTWVRKYTHSLSFIRKQKRLTFDLYHSVCLENTMPGIDQHSSHPDSQHPHPQPPSYSLHSPLNSPTRLPPLVLHQHTSSSAAFMLWTCSITALRSYSMTTHTVIQATLEHFFYLCSVDLWCLLSDIDSHHHYCTAFRLQVLLQKMKQSSLAK